MTPVQLEAYRAPQRCGSAPVKAIVTKTPDPDPGFVTHSARERGGPWNGPGDQRMRKMDGALMRQLAAAIALSALAIAAMLGVVGPAGAADIPGYHKHAGKHYYGAACPPREEVILFRRASDFSLVEFPTVPARTPYFTCVTGTVLLPGNIPPPPEYCCG